MSHYEIDYLALEDQTTLPEVLDRVAIEADNMILGRAEGGWFYQCAAR